MANPNSKKENNCPNNKNKQVERSTQPTLQEQLLDYAGNPDFSSKQKRKLLDKLLKSGQYEHLAKEDIKLKQALEELFTNEFDKLCYSKVLQRSSKTSEALQSFIMRYPTDALTKPEQVQLLLRICLTYIETIQLIDLVEFYQKIGDYTYLKELLGEFNRLVVPEAIELCLHNMEQDSEMHNDLKSMLKETRANLWATIVKDADEQEKINAAKKLLQLDSKKGQCKQLQNIAQEVGVSYVEAVDVYQKFAQELEPLKEPIVFWTYIEAPDAKEELKSAYLKRLFSNNGDLLQTLRNLAKEVERTFEGVVKFYMKHAQKLHPLTLEVIDESTTLEEVQVLLKQDFADKASILKVLDTKKVADKVCDLLLEKVFPNNGDVLQTLRNLAKEVECPFEGVVKFYMKHAQKLHPLTFEVIDENTTLEEVQVLLKQDFADKASILKVLNTTKLVDEVCDFLLEKVLQDAEQLDATLFNKLLNKLFSDDIKQTWNRFPKARLKPCFEEQFSVHYKNLGYRYAEILRVMQWDDKKKQNFIHQQVEEQTFNKQDWDDCELEPYIVNRLLQKQESIEHKLKKLVEQGLCLSLYEALSIYARNFEVTEELIVYILNSFLQGELAQEELVKLFVDAKWLVDEVVREMLLQYVSEDYTSELENLIDALSEELYDEDPFLLYMHLNTVFVNKTKQLKEELRKKTEDNKVQANLAELRKHLNSFTKEFEYEIALDLHAGKAEERWLTLYKNYREALYCLGYEKENVSLGDVLTVEQMEQYGRLKKSKTVSFDEETMEGIVAYIGMRLPQETDLKGDYAPKALIIERSEGK